MFEDISDRLKERAAKIQMIGFDVDGVLTDGSLYIGPSGEEFKKFFAMDGLGFKMAEQFGLKIAIISGRPSEQTLQRCQRDLGVKDVHVGVKDKLAKAREILESHQLSMENFAFIGDDTIDLTLLEQSGLAACTKDAHYSLFKHIHYITDREGGRGAAREFIDLILYSQGKIPS